MMRFRNQLLSLLLVLLLGLSPLRGLVAGMPGPSMPDPAVSMADACHGCGYEACCSCSGCDAAQCSVLSMLPPEQRRLLVSASPVPAPDLTASGRTEPYRDSPYRPPRR